MIACTGFSDCSHAQVKSAKIGLIYAWGSSDPFATYMEKHDSSDSGYVDLTWNLDCAPGMFFDIASSEPCLSLVA